MKDNLYFDIEKLKSIVDRNQNLLSGQLCKRLTNVIESSSDIHEEGGCGRIVRKTSAVFHRLLLELIQSHYNTKQRENDFCRLMKEKRCAITDPTLMEDIINIIVKLYKAGQGCANISFERSVLIKFIMKELNNSHLTTDHVGRTIQTLYKCSCFELVKKDDSQINEFKLKSHLCDATILSQHCDEELIKIAQENQIRLNPQSWAYLLHKNHPDVSRMQSIMDRCQTAPTVEELEQTLSKKGDKYQITRYLTDLTETQDILKPLMATTETDSIVDLDLMYALIKKLTKFEELYTLRQRRNTSTVAGHG